jgi:hypothetical protein
MPGGLDLRFHGVRTSDTKDAKDQFATLRCIRANAIMISSWDPQQLLVPAAKLTSNLALYDSSGERRLFDDAGAQVRRAHAVAAKAGTRCAADDRNKIFPKSNTQFPQTTSRKIAVRNC